MAGTSPAMTARSVQSEIIRLVWSTPSARDERSVRRHRFGAIVSASEVRHHELVGALALALVRLHGRGVDGGPVSIEGEQQARLMVVHVRLQPLERVFGYKERPLHRAIMTPEPDGTSGRIKYSASVREIEHRSGRFFTRRWRSSIFAGLRHRALTNNSLPDCARIS